jgi:hypothetical protein
MALSILMTWDFSARNRIPKAGIANEMSGADAAMLVDVYAANEKGKML